jgi:SAM-dependent methyltransferase
MNGYNRVISTEEISNSLIDDGFGDYLITDRLEGGFNYFDFHKKRFDFLLRILKNSYLLKSRFLDIGSLDGYMMLGAKLIGYNVAGTDLPEYVQAIHELSDHYGFDNRPADLLSSRLPFADGEFDLVLFSETLEHLNFHPAALFNEISRVMKPGASLVITTPNLLRLNNVLKLLIGQSINHEIELPYSAGTHYREYTAEELEYLVGISGLQTDVCKSLNFPYPDLGWKIKITDLMSRLFPLRRRDLIVIAKKNNEKL